VNVVSGNDPSGAGKVGRLREGRYQGAGS